MRSNRVSNRIRFFKQYDEILRPEEIIALEEESARPKIMLAQQEGANDIYAGFVRQMREAVESHELTEQLSTQTTTRILPPPTLWKAPKRRKAFSTLPQQSTHTSRPHLTQ